MKATGKIVVLIASIILFQSFIIMPKNKTEEQKYSLIRKYKGFEVRFGGYASDKDLKFYSEKLQILLKENGIKSFGNYRFLGYNAPFQLIGRRNEIIVSVENEQIITE